jgi:phosphate-selective porin
MKTLILIVLAVAAFAGGLTVAHFSIAPMVDNFSAETAKCDIAMNFYWASGEYHVNYRRFDGSAEDTVAGADAASVVVKAIEAGAPTEPERAACAEHYRSSVKEVCGDLGDSVPAWMKTVCFGRSRAA